MRVWGDWGLAWPFSVRGDDEVFGSDGGFGDEGLGLGGLEVSGRQLGLVQGLGDTGIGWARHCQRLVRAEG